MVVARTRRMKARESRELIGEAGRLKGAIGVRLLGDGIDEARPASRGGATGKKTKNTNPIAVGNRTKFGVFADEFRS